MRENNDFILSTVKSEQITKDIKKEVKHKDVILENKDNLNSINAKPISAEDEKTKERSLFKKEMSSNFKTVTHHSNKKNNMDLAQTNEVQFRILANKFNEAVEVILELSDKVKKLEYTVYKNHKDIKKGRSFYYVNIKVIFALILIPLLGFGIFKLPFDFFTMKLILSDIISTM